MKKLILPLLTALLAIALSTGAAAAKDGPHVRRTKSGLKYDTSKVTATMVTVTAGRLKGKKVAVLHPSGKKLTPKSALYGLSCAGCSSCGADIDSTNGRVTCRSLGCKPCKHKIIASEELQQVLQTATW